MILLLGLLFFNIFTLRNIFSWVCLCYDKLYILESTFKRAKKGHWETFWCADTTIRPARLSKQKQTERVRLHHTHGGAVWFIRLSGSSTLSLHKNSCFSALNNIIIIESLLICFVCVGSMQGATVQSGGVGLRGLPHAYWGLLQEQGEVDWPWLSLAGAHYRITSFSQH